MTLSDFDACALDESSRPTSAITEPSPSGIRVEVHRNWLNITDSRSWLPSAVLPPPITLTVSEGELTYLDTHIVAARGPQEGVYCACWFSSQNVILGMVAIGCVSRILVPCIDHLQQLLSLWAAAERIPRSLALIDLSLALRFNQGDAAFAQQSGFPVACTPPGVFLCDSPPAEKS